MAALSYAELLDKKSLHQADLQHPTKPYSAALHHGQNALANYYYDGGNNSRIVALYSWLIDQILSAIWQQLALDQQPIDLIAVGGYGRGELCLGSDVDLLLLADSTITAAKEEQIGQFIQTCWDVGLKVGHSVRSVEQCLVLAEQDLTIMTSLLESRLLLGQPQRIDALAKQLRNSKVWSVARFFREKRNEQEQRYERFADTAYNLEPNIKESPGGLRDIHIISWVANRHFGTSDLDDLVTHDFLSNNELRTLTNARRFLWKLRNGLFLLSRRPENRLLFDYQRELASQLGFRGDTHTLAVEAMMKKYYRIVNDVQLLNQMLLNHFDEAVVQEHDIKPVTIDGQLQIRGNYLETRRADTFSKHPETILRIFLTLQQHPELKGISARCQRQLLDNRHLVDARFRRSAENRRCFLAMFEYQEGLTHCLRVMNSSGILGRFFPEFGRIVGQMQHDLFHVYTVDAHSLIVVGKLRGLMMERNKDEFPTLRKLISHVNKRERLFLAALCHDIGKGSGRDHSDVGAEIAYQFCTQLGLSNYDRDFVTWLVQAHLIMSGTAQHQDTTDPRVIEAFAKRIIDQEHLDNLYLLTVADMRATSPKVWTDWKGRLLDTLYSETSRYLRSGIDNDSLVSDRIEERKIEIRKMVKDDVSHTHLQRFWNLVHNDYFLRHSPESAAWHARILSAASAVDLPVVDIRRRPDISALQTLIYAPASSTLLSDCTAALDSLMLNIMDARLHAMKGNVQLYIFIVQQDQPIAASAVDELRNNIQHYLLNPKAAYRPVRRSQPRAYKQFNTTTHIQFNQSDTMGYTIMNVVSQDRPGLIFHVAKALQDFKLHLVTAKISTVGERAEDTFGILTRDGDKVDDPELQQQLSEQISASLQN